jgi:hypothetical protein
MLLPLCVACGETTASAWPSTCQQALNDGGRITVTPLAVTMDVGHTIRLSTAGHPACTPMTLQVSPSSTAIVSLTSEGMVTANAVGRAYVRVRTVEGTIRDSVAITIAHTVVASNASAFPRAQPAAHMHRVPAF